MKKWKKVLLYVLTVLLVMAGVCGYFLFLYPHEQDFVESYYKVQSDKLTKPSADWCSSPTCTCGVRREQLRFGGADSCLEAGHHRHHGRYERPRKATTRTS